MGANSIFTLRENSILVAWCDIAPDEATLLGETSLDAGDKALLGRIKARHRRLEWLTTRLLLSKVEPLFSKISYHESGRPYVQQAPFSLSISHSSRLAAIALNYSCHPTGIDCESRSGRVLKIANKFASAKELSFCSANPANYVTLLWSAKEALFKTIDGGGVDFIKHIEIQPFDFSEEGGTFIGKITRGTHQEVQLRYLVLGDTVLVFTT